MTIDISGPINASLVIRHLAIANRQSSMLYSYLSDSIGSRFAAFHAGYTPKTIPINEQKIIATIFSPRAERLTNGVERIATLLFHGSIGGALVIRATIFPRIDPAIIPITPPI